MKFDGKLVQAYVNSIFSLMRLFKEGNIYMPLKYYFVIKEDNTPKRIMGMGTHRYSSRELYTLEASELVYLESFILNKVIPFDQDFLRLAFENYELSYETQDINLAFLALMAALETLFNPGDQEVTHRISRNVAILLGQDENDSRKLLKNVTELYSKRSKILHRGKRIATKEELIQLRSYVRESIKQIYRLGKNKEDLMDMLDSLGFGQKP